MSEPKLCPMLFSTYADETGRTCLEEKCAWWIPNLVQDTPADVANGRCSIKDIADSLTEILLARRP
jgi:hypothetical protein